jgi:hypothetical protein
MAREIAYTATRTSSEFHYDDSFCRINKGPVRSGKSVRCLIEIVRRASEQAKAKDGIRYSKWIIGRKSYPQLTSTTIKTWLHWFPEKYFGKIKWDSPISHHLKFKDIDCEVLFMPFESERDVDKLKSLEITGGYLNELQYLPESILKTLLERCNSYPTKTMGAPITFSAVWADTNPPDYDHWIAKLENNLPSTHKYFHDIPAVSKVINIPSDVRHAISRDGTIYINNPEADYINNLPTPYYYLNQIPALTDEEIRVTCLGEYGFTKHGKPVYSDYIDSIHFHNGRIPYQRDERLYMGWDFGLTPAVSFFQFQPNGTLAMIKEICARDYGVEPFAENIALPFLNSNFDGWRNNHTSWGDPSGKSGNVVSASPGNKKSCIDALNKLGIITRAAKTNELEARISSVSWFLRKTHGGAGAFVVSKDCPQSRKGFLGDYQYEKILIGEFEESTKPLPLKNFSSHIHDAIQYPCLHLREMLSAPDDDFNLSGSLIY